jgi:probable F420-dependent oxidoreductase
MRTIGAIGIAGSKANMDNPSAVADEAREVEGLGYSTLWVPGGQAQILPALDRAVRATTNIRIASGIVGVERVPAADLAALYAAVQRDQPDRLVLGLGGAHGSRPLQTVEGFLDELDASGVPRSARILAALGPKMLALARRRADGAYPYLVTPGYVTDARAALGPDRRLMVLLMVIPITNREAARRAAAVPLGFLGTVGGYRNNLLRLGFDEADIDTCSNRLVDAVTAWGDADAIATRIAEYQAAGADEVVLRITGADADEASWRARLAAALELT